LRLPRLHGERADQLACGEPPVDHSVACGGFDRGLDVAHVEMLGACDALHRHHVRWIDAG
jgi:hypothetical protein